MKFSVVQVALVLTGAYVLSKISRARQKEAAPSSPYLYSSLNSQRSIRVLILLPSWRYDAPIRGKLLEVSLDQDPVFEALSYVWGVPKTKQEIGILSKGHDGEEARSLLVTPNCIEALRAMRFRRKSRVIWVDAICIDQSSDPEKNQQVPLMSELYGRAERVLVWLNPGDQETKKVRQTGQIIRLISWLHWLRIIRLYETDEHTASRQPRDSRLVAACGRYVESRCRDLGDSFNAPFLNTYFQRVWTVQEIAKAHHIWMYYGPETFTWRDFVTAGLFTVKRGGFARNQQAEVYLFNDTRTHWTLLNSLESHFVLPDIYGVEALCDDGDKRDIFSKYNQGGAELALLRSRGLSATQSEDKAYAMLWAFPESSAGTKALFQVDYAKPLNVIYTEFSTAIFVLMKGSTYQLYNVNSTPRNSKLPSWVPDWAVNIPMSLYLWSEKLRGFRAAREDSFQYRLDIRGDLLKLSGTEYSTVRAIIRLTSETRDRPFDEARPHDVRESLIDMAAILQSIIDAMEQLTSLERPGILRALHRTIHSQMERNEPGPADQIAHVATQREVQLADTMGISVGLLRIQVFDRISFLMDEAVALPESVRNLLTSLLSEHEVDEVARSLDEHEGLEAFLALLLALEPFINIYRFLYIAMLEHRDKDFFITDKDNLGMAYHGLRSGGIVALLQGCPSPMLVEKIEAEGETFYRLHGPAYVDGIMDGEAWPEDTSGLQEIDLK